MTEEDIEKLREEAAYYGDKDMLRVLAELEKAWGERDRMDAAGQELGEENVGLTTDNKILRAQRDVAYALLRETAIWLDNANYYQSPTLRGRIAELLEKEP